MDDKQVAAIQAIVGALKGLEDEDLRVVLGFINLRYGAVATPAGRVASSPALQSHPLTTAPNAPSDDGGFGSFPDLYHAAQPTTDAEKALVGGYWIQKLEGSDSFSSQSVNQHLKEMGYPVGNITRAFDWLMSQKPQLVQQMKKAGSTKQARKLLKLTHVGLKRVEEMIQSRHQD